MKTLVQLIIIFSLALNLSAQTYGALISEGDKYYNEKDYKASLKSYLKAFKVKDASSTHLYNAACSASLAGKKGKAFKLLNESIDAGWIDVNHMKKDGDLNNLHDSKKWQEAITKTEKAKEALEAKWDKPLRNELMDIFASDQDIRRAYIDMSNTKGWDAPETDSLAKIMIHTDSVNLVRLEKILNERGWVGPDLVGSRASQAIFLVIQHSDLEVQEKYLPMMREAVEKGNARSASLALLEDRVALRQGKNQTYGSQVGRNPDTNESYVLPLDDPENVDERRAKMGLGPISEYVSRWSIEWDPVKYKEMLPTYEKWYRDR